MEVTPKLISYYNAELRVSLLVPEDWTAVQISPSMFRLFGVPESGLEEYFEAYRVSMSFELKEVSQATSGPLEALVKQNNLDMEKEYNAYHLLDDSFFELGPNQCYQKHYNWVEENTGLTLFQLQALLRTGLSDLYVVNAAVVKGLEKKYLPVFDNILKSLRIIPRP
jgi:hypothetical protein